MAVLIDALSVLMQRPRRIWRSCSDGHVPTSVSYSVPVDAEASMARLRLRCVHGSSWHACPRRALAAAAVQTASAKASVSSARLRASSV